MIRSAVWVQSGDDSHQQFRVDGNLILESRESDRADVISRISDVTSASLMHRWSDGATLFIRRDDPVVTCVVEVPLSQPDSAGRIVVASLLVEGTVANPPTVEDVRHAAREVDGDDLEARLPLDLDDQLLKLVAQETRSGCLAAMARVWRRQ